MSQFETLNSYIFSLFSTISLKNTIATTFTLLGSSSRTQNGFDRKYVYGELAVEVRRVGVKFLSIWGPYGNATVVDGLSRSPG